MKSPCQIQKSSERQKRRRQCRWRKFGLLTLCASFELSSTSHALEVPRKRRDQESSSVISSKTKAASIAEQNLHSVDVDSSWSKSKRMTNQGHLALDILTKSQDANSNDFTNRLLDELTTRQGAVVGSTTNDVPLPSSSLLLLGLVTLACTSAILTPTVFVDSLFNLLISSVALLVPWLWMERLSLFSKETAIMCITYVVQFVPRWYSGKHQYHFVFQRVLPRMLDALQRMLLVEAWSRIWRVAGTDITKLFNKLSSSEERDKNVSKDHKPDTPLGVAERSQQLVDKALEFVDTALKRGAHKAVTKTIQRNAQSAIETTLSSVAQVLLQLPLLLIPFTEGIYAGFTGQ